MSCVLARGRNVEELENSKSSCAEAKLSGAQRSARPPGEKRAHLVGCTESRRCLSRQGCRQVTLERRLKWLCGGVSSVCSESRRQPSSTVSGGALSNTDSSSGELLRDQKRSSFGWHICGNATADRNGRGRRFYWHRYPRHENSSTTLWSKEGGQKRTCQLEGRTHTAQASKGEGGEERSGWHFTSRPQSRRVRECFATSEALTGIPVSCRERSVRTPWL